jgi:hypothetical protein
MNREYQTQEQPQNLNQQPQREQQVPHSMWQARALAVMPDIVRWIDVKAQC